MENVPVHVNNSNDHRPRPATTPAPAPRSKRRRMPRVLMAITAVAAVLMIVAAGWLLYQRSGAGAIDSSRYQAVFFTNGQVYFGRLHQLGGGYMKLTDVYYIQSKDEANTDNPQENGEDAAKDMQLIKLGSELHGPEDAMMISKEQILFFENLKPTGEVAKSIANYKQQPNANQ